MVLLKVHASQNPPKMLKRLFFAQKSSFGQAQWWFCSCISKSYFALEVKLWRVHGDAFHPPIHFVCVPQVRPMHAKGLASLVPRAVGMGDGVLSIYVTVEECFWIVAYTHLSSIH